MATQQRAEPDTERDTGAPRARDHLTVAVTTIMVISAEQLSALRVILRATEDECRHSPVGNLLEGHLKVVAVGALLSSGYAVMEGANQQGQGRVISLSDGVINTSIKERQHMPSAPGSEKAKNSPDIRIWAPCRLVVELQIRSKLGSQCALFSDNLVDDLDRVDRRTADAFVLAADLELYDALRGLKSDQRGRKAKHTELLASALPPASGLPESIASSPIRTHGGRLFCVGSRIRTSFGIDRVVLGVWAAAQDSNGADAVRP